MCLGNFAQNNYGQVHLLKYMPLITVLIKIDLNGEVSFNFFWIEELKILNSEHRCNSVQSYMQNSPM